MSSSSASESLLHSSTTFQTKSIVDLPDVIYLLLQNYISNYDYRCFMNTSKADFSAIKRKTIYSSLYVASSRDYVIDDDFRHDVLDTIEDPSRQVSISFKYFSELKEALDPIYDPHAHTVPDEPLSPSNSDEDDDEVQDDDHEVENNQNEEFSDVSGSDVAGEDSKDETKEGVRGDRKDTSASKEAAIILPIHHIRFHEKITLSSTILDFTMNHFIPTKITAHHSNINCFPLIPSLQYLNITGHRLTDISHLSRLKNVSLYNCSDLTKIEALRNVQDVVLFDCPLLTDFSCLGNQHSLEISHCSGLTDVTTFTNIHRLEIIACAGIRNLAPLGRIYDLTLDLCWERHALTSLTSNHHRLKLINLSESITGYEILHNIPHVSLETSFIIDLSVLAEAKSVSLERCYKVSDVSPLVQVQEVTLKECSKITDISVLRGVRVLTIGYLSSVTSYSGLGDHQTVKLIKARNLTNDFPFINTANPTNMTRHVHLHQIGFVQTLIDQENCPLKNLYSLHISECSQLTHVKRGGGGNEEEGGEGKDGGGGGLGDIHTIVITKCHSLVDISGLGKNNHTVQLTECSKVVDVSSLKTVSVVRLLECRQVKNTSELKKVVPRLLISYYDRD